MDKSWLQPDLIDAYSLDTRQFMDFRESTLSNGMRIIEAYNSSGLTFTLLPDRGMDIWSAAYNGMPLTWIAPGSPHPPDYGQIWQTQFNGGLLTTCGLTHVGPPEDGRDIHGEYTRLRAVDISAETRNQTIRLTSTIYQSTLFGTQFKVKRTFVLKLGEPQIELHDEVTNIGDEPTPFMMLYHCNVGYPMVRENTELLVDSIVYPRDEDAQYGVETWNRYAAPAAGYREQVFFHHVKTRQNERKDVSNAALLNDDIGLDFSWNTRTMPYLTQWKNTRQGQYVCGIEPSNCVPEGQNAAREAGRLVMLQPAEKQTFDLFLGILDGKHEIEAYRLRQIEDASNRIRVQNFNLSDYEAHIE